MSIHTEDLLLLISWDEDGVSILNAINKATGTSSNLIDWLIYDDSNYAAAQAVLFDVWENSYETDIVNYSHGLYVLTCEGWATDDDARIEPYTEIRPYDPVADKELFPDEVPS